MMCVKTFMNEILVFCFALLCAVLDCTYTHSSIRSLYRRKNNNYYCVYGIEYIVNSEREINI